MANREKMKGFTLFELIVTIAVAAIIVGFGVPGFASFIDNNRAVTHTNDVVTALNLARSEATRRGTDVLVCRSEDGTACNNGTDWTVGWVVMAGDEVLRAWPKRSGGDGIVTADDTAAIRFRARGSLGGGGTRLDVQLPRCSGNENRAVSVNAAGRIAVTRTSC